MDDAVNFESRAVTRTIPRFIRVVPADDASEMCANGRTQKYFSIFIAIRRNFFAVELENFSFASFQFIQRLAFCFCKTVAQHIKWIIQIFREVAPRAAVKFFSRDVEQIEPRVFSSEITVACHRCRECAERKSVAAKSGGDELFARA